MSFGWVFFTEIFRSAHHTHDAPRMGRTCGGPNETGLPAVGVKLKVKLTGSRGVPEAVLSEDGLPLLPAGVALARVPVRRLGAAQVAHVDVAVGWPVGRVLEELGVPEGNRLPGLAKGEFEADPPVTSRAVQQTMSGGQIRVRFLICTYDASRPHGARTYSSTCRRAKPKSRE